MSFKPEQVAALQAKLDPRHVASRTQSGRALSYIEGWWAIAEANRIFGHDAWTRETVEIKCVSERPREIGQQKRPGFSVSYVAKVRVTVDGVVREGIGAGHGIDVDCGLAHESAIKEAETDAMKRALMTFGNPFGLALYDKSQANVGVDAPHEGAAFDAETGEVRTLPPPPSKAALKRSGIYETLRDEMDACKSLDELEAWNLRRGKDIRALPKDWFDALADRFAACREALQPPTPETRDAEADLDEAYRQTVGDFRGNGDASLSGRGSAVGVAAE